MNKYGIILWFFAVIGISGLSGTRLMAIQADTLAPELKEAALRDAACSTPADAGDVPTLTTLPILSGGHEAATIVKVQSPCHCQGTNCDTLVYLHTSQGYSLALKERYTSLHAMKIVKKGMPSITGQFDVTDTKMETTVYDWDGKAYGPSLCATVVKHGRVPSITRHPCKAAAQKQM
ncbi:MAG TPA: hypothetical protein VFT65_17655 [Candidatus Angelobacter sp.]|nr:hypothetical protein [Candidatus Angelobacter sp.]